MLYLADYFASIWNSLDKQRDEISRLSQKEAVEIQRLHLEADRLLSDHSSVHALMRWERSCLLHKIAAAQAIDAWYSNIHCCYGLAMHGEILWSQALAYYVSNLRLNADESLGKVILKRPHWGRHSDDEQDLPENDDPISSLFGALIVLPLKLSTCDPDGGDRMRDVAIHFTRRDPSLSDPKHLEERWKVGFIPLAQNEQEYDFQDRDEGGEPYYELSVHEGHHTDLCARMQAAFRNLCSAGCQIIAMPELVLTDRMLHALRETIAALNSDSGSKLALVLAGTRLRASPDGGPPFNEAVVLDHTGSEILKQQKLSRWNLDPVLCQRYGLTPVQNGLRREYITPGETMYIVEQPGLGRIAVLVCEDLARSEPGKWLRGNMCIELQFTPVFDGSLTEERWSSKKGAEAAQSACCRLIVANSMILTRRTNRLNVGTLQSHHITGRCGFGMVINGFTGQHARRLVGRPIPTNGASVDAAVAEWILMPEPGQ